MKTGVIVLAHRPDSSVVPVAEWYARRLSERGHKDVRVAYHSGEPNVRDVIAEMNVHGENNTFVILPLLVAEGDLSTWIMPKNIGMPDNSCSYTYLTGTHIAIRFATTFGRINALSETLLKRLREAGAERDDGVLLVARGSRLSMCEAAADKHAWYISEHGFPIVSYALISHGGPSVESAVRELEGKGASRIVVLPMFLYEGESVVKRIPEAVGSSRPGVPVVYAKCLGADDLLLDDMDRKIPEGW
jgi:sirohydrochlorin ferrochelatase